MKMTSEQNLLHLYQTSLKLKKNQKFPKELLNNDKGSKPPRGLTILNIYAPNTGVTTFIKQILLNLKRETGTDAIKVGDSPHSQHLTDNLDRKIKKHWI